MFGYIRPYVDELKVGEFKLFRAYYCGLCKSLGENYGKASKLALSYDCCFLAIMLDSLSDDEPCAKPIRCVANPLNKRPAITNNANIDFAAAINVLLARGKALDDWHDERKSGGAAFSVAIAHANSKAKKLYPECAKVIETQLKELSAFEKQNCSEPDLVSDCFARLLKDILEKAPASEGNKRILGQLGYNLGRWIYLLDAFDDWDKDIKKGNYNVYAIKYKAKGKEKAKDDILFGLEHSLVRAEQEYDLLDIRRMR